MSEQGPATRTIRLAPAATTRAETDDQLSTELDAIITIGRALSHIPDAETRARVMRWAIDRFGIDVTREEAPAGDLSLPAGLVPDASPEPIDALNVDGLAEFFPAQEQPRDKSAAFGRSHHRDTRRSKPTAADRLRGALHWMGI